MLFFITMWIEIKGQSNNKVNNTYIPHRYEIPCDSGKLFVITFKEAHNNIEVILTENGFAVDYIARQSVVSGDTITVTTEHENPNAEYTITVKESGTIIYKKNI